MPLALIALLAEKLQRRNKQRETLVPMSCLHCANYIHLSGTMNSVTLTNADIIVIKEQTVHLIYSIICLIIDGPRDAFHIPSAARRAVPLGERTA